MGYDQEKIAADIDEVLALYHQHWNDTMGQEIITKAYRDYPNDYRIMHSYMWNIAGDRADNDPSVLLAHKDELGSICDKILEGCTDDNFRLGAWNMKAKLFMQKVRRKRHEKFTESNSRGGSTPVDR